MTYQIAEYIDPTVGDTLAGDRVREAQEKLERVSEVLVNNARLLHKQLHPILEGGMAKCKMVSCRVVRNTFGLD